MLASSALGMAANIYLAHWSDSAREVPFFRYFLFIFEF
jgi:hypothetical protein